jgi:hypothetical protein
MAGTWIQPFELAVDPIMIGELLNYLPGIGTRTYTGKSYG